MGRKSKEEKVIQKDNNYLFKTKECKVIYYNPKNQNLDIDFDGYGIRVKNITNFIGNTVTVKYKSEIGNADFEFRI